MCQRKASCWAAGAHAPLETLRRQQGFTDNSRDDWGSRQLADANQFARQTERRVLRREASQDTNTAWVISTTVTEGQFDGRKLVLDGTETMLLRRGVDGWRIAHIHWSAHSPQDE